MGNNFFIQGLMGIGLVGFNVADFLQKGLKSKVIRSYSEFFPSVAFLDSKSKLATKTIEVSKTKISNGPSDSNIFIMNGSQPEEDTLAYFLMKTVEKDIRAWNEDNSIDLYIAFGASVTEFVIPSYSASEVRDVAKNIIQEEKKKNRRIYIAFAGEGSENHPFIKQTKKKFQLEAMGDGKVITGMNGVLPAYIGVKTGLPVITAMIEASIPSYVQSIDNPLNQFIGLAASKYGLNWINSFLKFDDSPIKMADKYLDKIEPHAISQLEQMLKMGHGLPKDRAADRKMYV
ncbi:MAG: PAC2 family protein [Candidatus Hermodarchaeota archaeon]